MRDSCGDGLSIPRVGGGPPTRGYIYSTPNGVPRKMPTADSQVFCADYGKKFLVSCSKVPSWVAIEGVHCSRASLKRFCLTPLMLRPVMVAICLSVCVLKRASSSG